MMNNKVKQVLVLLFVVSTLFIMIGSVSANTDDLNETLETSNALNSDLSAVSEDIDSGADKYVSNQLTISDEKTNASETTLGSSDSNVVSNYEDTTIDSKDSDNNVIKASIDGNDILSAPNLVISSKSLNPTVNNVGDWVAFEIVVRNMGSTTNGIIEVDLFFNPDELDFKFRQPGANLEAPPGWNFDANHLEPERIDNGHVVLKYDCKGDFLNNHYFNVTAIFQTKASGKLETEASVRQGSSKAKAHTIVGPYLTITNTALNPYANVGDEVEFDIYVENIGATYAGMYNSAVGHFVGLNLEFDPNQLEYADKYTLYTDWTDNYLTPLKYPGLVQFGYHTWTERGEGFKNGYNFHFKIAFKVKSAGELKLNASVLEVEHPAYSVAQTDVAKFEITNTALNPYANVGEIISFEVFGKNIGGTFIDNPIGIGFNYNPNQLKYISFTSSQGNFNLPGMANPNLDWNSNGLLFGVSNQEGFKNGDCFNFTINFQVLNYHGKIDTNAFMWNDWGVTSPASTISTEPNFEITIGPDSYVNIGDILSFEISGKNIGGTFMDDLFGIGLNYNSSILKYISFDPKLNSDKYDLGENPNPNFEMNPNGILFGITQNFKNGDTFNFTVNFEVIGHGTFDAVAYWWQAWNKADVAHVTSCDPTFTITHTPAQGSNALKVGDNVAFHYDIQNQGSKYADNVDIQVDFDADKLQFLSLNANDNLEIKSIYYTSAHNSNNGLLGASDGDVLGADSSVGHLVIGYTEDGFGAGDSVSFDVNFKAVTSGKLQTSASLQGDASKYSTTVYGTAYSGDLNLKLTKTPDAQFKNVGDYVYYTIRLENNGTLYLTGYDYIDFNDHYLPGLKYLGYDIEGLEDHINKNDIEHNIDVENGGGHVYVKYNINDEDGFAPGSVIEFKLIFEILEPGIRCNYIFCVGYKYSNVSSVAVEEPDFNLTKKCLNDSVDINDLVYYEIFLENTGNISYFDHENAYGDQYLMIEDLYPEGLEFVSYIINPDKNGNTWEDNYESITDDPDNHCLLIKYKTWNGWEPGDTLNITLIFKAVKYGKLVNNAHVYWHWKDFGPKESQRDVELDDEAEVVVGPAKFDIQKISNFKTAKVGDVVSFSIVYTNTGDKTITGAYIIDDEYSSGLKYLYYADENDWTKEGNKWYYNGKIEGGQSVTLKLFFEALTAGQMSNTAKAGHSESDVDKEDTDTVLIKEGVNGTATTEGQGMGPEEPDDDPDEKLDKEPKDKPDGKSAAAQHKVNEYAAKNTIHETGNPFVVLLLSLLTLCFVGRKGKK